MKTKFKLNIQFFAEDNPQPSPVDPTPEPTPDPNNPTDALSYAEALKKVRDSTVPKEEYDKLSAEHQTLLRSTMDNRQPHQQQPEEKIKLEDLRKEILTERLTNYDFVEKSLKLRKEVIEAGGLDPFVSEKSDRFEEDLKEAERVAKVLQETLDECKDNHELFSAALQLKLRDDDRLKMSLAAKKAKGQKG